MNKKDILIGLALAVFLAIIISPFASSWPDGLEKVAEDKGFIDRGEIAPVVASPVPDYAWPGVPNEIFATSAAGALGTVLVFGLGYALAALLKRRHA